MVYTRSRQNCTNTGVSDESIPEELEMLNPLSSNNQSWVQDILDDELTSSVQLQDNLPVCGFQVIMPLVNQTTPNLSTKMHQQLANVPSPLQGQIPVTTAEIPKNIEEAEINEEVGPKESGNPGDPGGSDSDSPGGPRAPCSSRIPSHSRSPVEQLSQETTRRHMIDDEQESEKAKGGWIRQPNYKSSYRGE
ncbi:hypothetical protein J3R30DRAFT_3685918 [Lentinula aciculospora]|uniref:Uncharacterized protein n=1 Tax=Lentinula aciculospora TaxID=153920 RepID=A0A9W9A216_9AGAR|nr:hypothetical protein J3R30DRAFT_3685918 [Lentinula aciculospora]